MATGSLHQKESRTWVAMVITAAVAVGGWAVALFGDIRGNETTISQMELVIAEGILPLAREKTAANREAIDQHEGRINQLTDDVREIRNHIWNLKLKQAALAKSRRYSPKEYR